MPKSREAVVSAVEWVVSSPSKVVVRFSCCNKLFVVVVVVVVMTWLSVSRKRRRRRLAVAIFGFLKKGLEIG